MILSWRERSDITSRVTQIHISRGVAAFIVESAYERMSIVVFITKSSIHQRGVQMFFYS